MDPLSQLLRFSPVSLLGRFSDSRPAIIASVSIEREHRLCCFCPAWSTASPREMQGACHVFSLSRHGVQLSNPNCSLTGRQICSNRGPAPYVVHQTYKSLESLTGHLHHAYEVVRPRRTFLRRMLDRPTSRPLLSV